MKLTEDLAKALLKERGLPVPEGSAAASAEEAAAAARALGGEVAVKALIPTGRRGKAGLVRLTETAEEAAEAAGAMIGAEAMGGKIARVYVERRAEIAREFYLSFAFGDRTPRLVISCEGGVDIESVHAERPERVVVKEIDPLRGLKPWDAIDCWIEAGLSGRELAAVGRLTAELYEAFVALDAVMMEINPLTLDAKGAPSLVGAMMEIDDFALHRQRGVAADGRPEPSANPREAAVEAANRAYPGANSRYTELDGDIGLLVAGGGAGLLQHDMIVAMGGRPANHSDVSPAPGTEKMEAVLDGVFTNPRSRGLLIGYNYLQMAPCDQVAKALKISVERNGIDARRFPIVLRLFGPAEAEAREIVATIPGAYYLPAGASLEDGCRAVVNAVREATR
ncbi:ATP-grasp domain-containing protein [Pikeienuella sp. HZG-20]|uniref:ATP-grasp domain-containing protein n=1 Tax=Paludibacillus litoralis TaxID=3133267 RepID=UPI0030EC8663